MAASATNTKSKLAMPTKSKSKRVSGRSAAPCSAFEVGDRVTTVKSESLPESMEGIPCIVTNVDHMTDEEYFRYEVTYRMDHKTPIKFGEDTIATELLDRSNLTNGWPPRH